MTCGQCARGGNAEPWGGDRDADQGMNGYIEDGSHETLGDPERRRIWGAAAQSVFTALLLCTANLRKVESYQAEA
jgi:hypothetical protein